MQDQYTHTKIAHSYVLLFQPTHCETHQCAIGVRRNILSLRSVASVVQIIIAVKTGLLQKGYVTTAAQRTQRAMDGNLCTLYVPVVRSCSGVKNGILVAIMRIASLRGALLCPSVLNVALIIPRVRVTAISAARC